MWVKFTADYDYKPHSQATIAYKAGMVLNVTQDCQRKAIAAGKAVEMDKKSKMATATEKTDDDSRSA
ncbi:hypothetical protein [Mesorhizobium sp. B2-4-4]|uniref:hypothetical protein n=1 Tax=Mesorhizobium sp. B2-4-4 TaxID=2589945 RepID=UPI001FEFC77B|nr:hypothetical protein [Mesorhizobium sp. B2-4-4]